MSKITTNGKIIEIYDLQNHEIINLLKLNVKCTLSFVANEIEMYSICLYERIDNGKINLIQLTTSDDLTIKAVEYSKLVDLISKKLQRNILVVKIEKQDFKDKEPLLLMLNDLKSDIIENCVKIDYDNKKHVFLIENRTINKLPNKLYYFEDTDTILAFSGNDGVKLVTGKTNSFEDLACN